MSRPKKVTLILMEELKELKVVLGPWEKYLIVPGKAAGLTKLVPGVYVKHIESVVVLQSCQSVELWLMVYNKLLGGYVTWASTCVSAGRNPLQLGIVYEKVKLISSAP